jgi:two-component system, sensor histidine kinase and response regulator
MKVLDTALLEFIKSLFNTNFMPHGYCLRWDAGVLWLHVISDVLITLAYFCIPILLVIVARRRKDIPFNWIFAAFGIFILACGASHLMAIVIIWKPLYRLEGLVKAVTAFASVVTAFLLVRLIPTLLSIPSAVQLSEANRALARQIEEKEVVEAELNRFQEQLQHLNQGLADRNQALEAERKRAEEASQAKSSFLAAMSHEIRTPMNGVVGMADLLMDTPLNSQQNYYLSAIRSSGTALVSIINDILDFSKIEAGKLEMEEAAFDLDQLVYEVLDLAGAAAASKDLELALELDENVALDLVGDPGRLRQVLMNLLSNAIKFTPRGRVLLSIAGDGEEGAKTRLRFSVADTGIGLTSEQIGMLFHAFQQGDRSTTRRFGGTGLGLIISKRLIEAMGGSIGVSSQPGVGSVFTFTVLMSRAQLLAVGAPLSLQRTGLLGEGQGSEQIVRMLEREAIPVRRLAYPDATGFDFSNLDLLLVDTAAFSNCRDVMAIRAAAPPELSILLLGSPHDWPDEACSTDAALSQLTYLSKPVRRWALLEALQQALSGAARLPLEPSGSPGNERLVLLVEDNRINQVISTKLLESMGCRVELAQNGVEACEAFLGQRYDLILMDCQMPEMDGLQATKRIRELEGSQGSSGNWRTPIIALSAGALSEERELCLAAGMDDFLAKPTSRQSLAAALERWLPVSSRT